MGTGRAVGVLFAVILLGVLGFLACGTQLDISPDTTGMPDAGGGSDVEPDTRMRATGGDCVFDDSVSKFDDACGFGK